ncbi:uncharacterized protein LOC127835668 [Dreissena polymorpha]|uniref:uncharacterized protein LOC127835668 n=1 Tax=Dreissena polymorpha TaxID=45954 RepID=UPI002264CA48|nr:uncharacterized protein LOC127835668 [Dreissena polymorpha]
MRVVHFIRNYADERGLPQPAAPRGVDNVPTVYLTSDTTKTNLHQQYQTSCTEAGSRVIEITAFKEIGRMCLPHIRIAGPRDDVCAKCETLRRGVMDAVTEEEKLTATDSFRNHILLAQKERDVYNDCIRKSKEANEGPDRYVHFTFDFSQNVSLPHYSRQIGWLYFLTLRKVQIFGVRVDSIPRQLNFLIDEDQTIGKDGKTSHGPDAVLSMLDWALQNYESDAYTCSVHADNCPGQNKNRYVLGYFMWRAMTGQHRLIEYHMQVPGMYTNYITEK